MLSPNIPPVNGRALVNILLDSVNNDKVLFIFPEIEARWVNSQQNVKDMVKFQNKCKGKTQREMHRIPGDIKPTYFWLTFFIDAS
jgi:hypothetical protein